MNDLVDYKLCLTEAIKEEITMMGVMCDFEPQKKHIIAYTEEELLIVIDKTQEYGETFLMCVTLEAKEDYMRGILEKEQAVQLQLEAEARAEEERKAAEYARLNVTFEDKPMISKAWVSETTADTDSEIGILSDKPLREPISIEISRPKQHTKKKFKFSDKDAESSGYTEFRAYKDPNFKAIREGEMGIQVAPTSAGEKKTDTL